LYRAARCKVDHYRRQQIGGGRRIFASREDGEADQIRVITVISDELAIFG
jgi:hypothetical protein